MEPGHLTLGLGNHSVAPPTFPTAQSSRLTTELPTLDNGAAAGHSVLVPTAQYPGVVHGHQPLQLHTTGHGYGLPNAGLYPHYYPYMNPAPPVPAAGTCLLQQHNQQKFYTCFSRISSHQPSESLSSSHVESLPEPKLHLDECLKAIPTTAASDHNSMETIHRKADAVPVKKEKQYNLSRKQTKRRESHPRPTEGATLVKSECLPDQSGAVVSRCDQVLINNVQGILNHNNDQLKERETAANGRKNGRLDSHCDSHTGEENSLKDSTPGDYTTIDVKNLSQIRISADVNIPVKCETKSEGKADETIALTCDKDKLSVGKKDTAVPEKSETVSQLPDPKPVGSVDREFHGSLPDDNMAKPGSPASITPYYHCMYSCIRQAAANESPSRKVHATTYTPEIGASTFTQGDHKPLQESAQLVKFVPMDIERTNDPLKIGNEVLIGDKRKWTDGQAVQSGVTQKDYSRSQHGRLATAAAARLPLEGGVNGVTTPENDSITLNGCHGDSRSDRQEERHADAIMKDSKSNVNKITSTTQGNGGSHIIQTTDCNTNYVISRQNGSQLSDGHRAATTSVDLSVQYTPVPSRTIQAATCFGNVPLDMSCGGENKDETDRKNGSRGCRTTSARGCEECKVSPSRNLPQSLMRADDNASVDTSSECKQTPVSHKRALEQIAVKHDQGSVISSPNANGVLAECSQGVKVPIQNTVTRLDLTQNERVQTNGITTSCVDGVQNVNSDNNKMKGSSKARNLDTSDTRITRGEEVVNNSAPSIPIGIAVAQQRHGSHSSDRSGSDKSDMKQGAVLNRNLVESHKTSSHKSPNVNSDITNRRSRRDGTSSKPSTDLGSNLIVTGGDTGRPGFNLPSTDAAVRAMMSSPWLGAGHTANSALLWSGGVMGTPSTGSLDPQGHPPLTVPIGFKLAQDPATRQYYLIPDLPGDSRQSWPAGYSGSSGSLPSTQQLQLIAQQCAHNEHEREHAQHLQQYWEYVSLLQQYYRHHPLHTQITSSASLTGSSHNPATYTSPTQHHQHHTARGSATSPLKPSLRTPTPSRDPQRDYPSLALTLPPVTQPYTLPSQYSHLLVTTTSHSSPVVTTSPKTTISRGTSPIHVATPSGDWYRRNSIEQCTAAVQTCFSPEPEPQRRPETKDMCIQTSKLHLESEKDSEKTAHVQRKDDIKPGDRIEEIDICDNNEPWLCSADSSEKCSKPSEATEDVEDAENHSKKTTDTEHPMDLRTKQSDQDSIVKSESIVQKSLETGALSECESVQEPDIPNQTKPNSFAREANNGLELLSFLAEQRSIELKEEQRLLTNSRVSGDIKIDINRNYSSISRVLTSPKLVSPTLTSPKLVSPTLTSPKIPRTLSNRSDRSDDENCYYMSGGVRLKDGVDTMDPLELDMRMKMAEIQRRYKEKQRELAKLQPKEHRSQSRKGPGRPKKRARTKTLSTSSRIKSTEEEVPKTKKAKPEMTNPSPAKGTKASSKPANKPVRRNTSSYQDNHGTEKVDSCKKTKKTEISAKSHKNVTKDVENILGKDITVAPIKRIRMWDETDSFASDSQTSDDDGSDVQLKMGSACKAGPWKTAERSVGLLQSKREPSGLLAKFATGELQTSIAAATSAALKTKHSKKRKKDDGVSMMAWKECMAVKRRKPGRPRKMGDGASTETIVAKKSGLSPLNNRKPKSEINSKEKKQTAKNSLSFCRRSERIFLSSPEVPSHPCSSPSSFRKKVQTSRLTNVHSLSQKLKKKYAAKATARAVARREKSKAALAKSQVKKEIKCEPYSSPESDSEEDVPLISLRNENKEVRDCVLKEAILKDGLRVLMYRDGLFYEGKVRSIQPPDIYGVVIDGERGNRPHVYSQEQLLDEVILDVKPEDIIELQEGMRICAYWSEQFSCLYPGTVSKASFSPPYDPKMVYVEFDDGDSGKMPLHHIRMIPQDFPIVDYDNMDTIDNLGKKKKRTISEDLMLDHKDRRPSISDTLPIYQLLNRSRTREVKKGRGKGKGKVGDIRHSLDSATPTLKEEEDPFSYSPESERRHSIESSSNGTRNLFSSFKHSKKTQQNPPQKNKMDDSETDDADSTFDYDSDDDISQISGSHGNRLQPWTAKGKLAEVERRASLSNLLNSRELWKWRGGSTKRPGMKGKARKEYYRAITRGKEHIQVGDCAVFVSNNRPNLPFVGQIESMWEAWGSHMVVKVKWFYHPEETKGLSKKAQLPKGGLFHSSHADENDVQTISHKCEVLSYSQYKVYKAQKQNPHASDPYSDIKDIFYLAGTYEPTIGQVRIQPGVPH